MSRAHVLWAAATDLPTGWPLANHVHSFYHLFFMRAGKTEFTLDQTSCELRAGTCIVVPPGVLHGIPAEEHSLLDALEVKFTLSDPALTQRLSTRPALIRDETGYLEHMLRRIVYHWARNGPACADTADTILTALLLSLPSSESGEDEYTSSYIDVSTYPTVTRRIISYVEKNHCDKILLDQIAQDMGYHKGYLCSIFRRTTGMTIVEYINHVRIRHAADCFYYYSVPISVIARHVGFATTVHFDRVFRQLVGVSPSTYRSCFAQGDMSESHRLTCPHLSLYEEILGSRILPLEQSVEGLLLLGHHAAQQTDC